MQLCSLLLVLGLAIGLSPQAFALRGVVDDPDGFTYLRAGASKDSAIVAKVKTGEVFDFDVDQTQPESEWLKVTLASGKQGYMHLSRIRFHATMADLADSHPGDEANRCARAKGLDYYPLARAAARGEKASMQTYFGLRCDGSAGDMHALGCRAVIHLLGDEKLSKFLRGQSREYLLNVRELIEYVTPGAFPTYMKRVFPKASLLLYPESAKSR